MQQRDSGQILTRGRCSEDKASVHGDAHSTNWAIGRPVYHLIILSPHSSNCFSLHRKAWACITIPSRMVLKLKKMGGHYFQALWCILIILWHVSCPLDSIMKCIKRNWQLTKMFLIMVFICSFMIPSTRVAWPLFVWTSKQCLFQKPCNRWELLPW